MPIAIIVEGKNDRNKLKQILDSRIRIICTYGTPSSDRLYELQKKLNYYHIFIFTDNDLSGRKIRSVLREMFIDAEHIYTKKEYAGVEGTPAEYIIQQLEKFDLHDFIIYPQLSP